MSVSGVTNNNNVTDVNSTRNPKSELDGDAFMLLLIEQMKNQDPLSPMEDTEFIAQTAQFSMLEEMHALRDEFSNSTAFNLIGKYVLGQTENSVTGLTEYVQGIVDSVSISGDEIFLSVGEHFIKPESVVGVSNE